MERVRSQVFDSLCPVRFTLPGIDFPLCVNAPRVLSLGTFVWTNLAPFLKVDTRDLWFSVDGQRIKWELPIGVIFDALGRAVLDIVVRLDEFPQADVLRCDNAQIVSSNFDHTFKASSFATTGNLQLVELNTNIHRNIEACVVERNWSTFEQLLAIKLNSIDQWRRFPVRFVLQDLTVQQRLLQRGAVVSGTTHGIAVEGIAVEEAVAGLIYPDGFLYLVVEAAPPL
jgi:hypothetical protein